ncbi:PQQ-binding-like beta-propeller repeat protein [Halalkaliarchaeum sp. AArc-GB]|uniref:outer membrane protein assembly factor BamB family protein n=1 Tax=Halalkaliarchaeum sp. AArc-GB TaxID=3074078 RepID=UPI0028623B41|nr:PQQ-binding-like beta-propeller repeat protein [Halalkaliarchaeum sp. AArc-GB]MDR5673412.1 PQQ-binding-like beta-propeller repeat protein [Halalkaliarchaeum sp. AArc-GB]
MSKDVQDLSRRQLLDASMAVGLAGMLAGCSTEEDQENGTETAEPTSEEDGDETEEQRHEEPADPPAAVADGFNLDAARDATAEAIHGVPFEVFGHVTEFTDPDAADVSASQAKLGVGDSDEETARHVRGSHNDTAITDNPLDADRHTERFYRDGEVVRRRVSDEADYDRGTAQYSDFADRVERDLDYYYELGTYFEFAEPEWSPERGLYVVEGVGFEDEEQEEAIDIEQCAVYVNPNGVVVGIATELVVEDEESIRTDVEGETDPGIDVEEPAWMDEVDAALPLWTVRVGERPTTTVHDEAVIVSSDEVVAVDRDDGSQRWNVSVEWEDDRLTNRATHTVEGEVVFVGTNEDDVFALDREDGSMRWSNTVDTRLPQPTVVDDIVVFAGLDGVYAFHAEDGSAAWTWGTDQSVTRRMFHEGTLFVGDTEGIVTAIDVTTGSERWQATPPTRSWVAPSVVSEGQLYAGAFEGTVYGFDAENGSIEWQYSTDDTTVSVTHGDGTVYVGDRSGMVYALDDSDGAEQWTFDTGDTARPHPRGGSIYVGSHDGSMYRLSAEDGDVHWTFETDGWVERPAITDNSVYVGSRDGNLYAIEADTGEERWQRELRFWARHRPTVRDGVVYATDFGRGGGIVYAFDTHPSRR